MANIEAKYVKTTLSKGEKVKEIFQEHWIVKMAYWTLYFAGVVILLMGPLFFYFGDPDGKVFGWLYIAGGIMLGLFGVYLNVEFYFREIVLTNKRFVYKRGIIGRRTQEQLLVKTDTVEMNQGIVGRILGYATIKLTTTGGAKVVAGDLLDAQKAKKKIEEAL
ncbi:MAG: PH domain-containing protein [Candidatus Portiera sp.]|nr:PH domain-containing protein [Portiera sp.]